MADIFPNEVFPADAEVALLDGTTDQPTGLPYIAKGTGPASVPSYEIQYNRRLMRQSRRLDVATEGLVVDEGGLQIGVYPCNYTLGGVHRRFGGARSQIVPDNDTRFVFIDSDNILQIAAAYPVDISTFIPLAKVVATNGALAIQPDLGYARLSASAPEARIGVIVGTETSDAISVTFQLEDAAGQSLGRRWLAEVWLSESNFGDLAATAPSGGMSVLTGQQLGAAIVANKHLKVVSDAAGVFAVSVTDVGTPIFYMMAVGMGIDLPTSSAIIFA